MNRRTFLATLLAAGGRLRAEQQAPPPCPIRLVDVARRAGLTVPTVFGGRTENKYILETTGCGAAFFDYDNDGWPDLFLVNGSTLEEMDASKARNRLYHNNRDGTFTDVTEKAGLLHPGWGQGVCIGDYDNDGFDDLFISYWGHDVLYHNNGDGTFTDVTAKAGLRRPEVRWGAGCAFLDYDRDGHLDLFVSNYVEFDLKTIPLPGSAANCMYMGLPVNCGPRGLPKARNYLFHNNGDGTFTDVTEKSGIGAAAASYGLGVLVSDFNNDGWPDIYVANDSDQSYLFWNNRDGTFTEAGMEAGVGTSMDGRNQSGMGVSAGDFDGNGWLDIFKTNFADDQPNLYRNHGKGYFADSIMSAGLHGHTQLLGWGGGFFDGDNDGLLDLLYVNGHVFPEIDRLKGKYGYRQPKVMYHQLPNGKFEDLSVSGGPAVTSLLSARACVFGDYDNDGRIDVLINPINDLPELLHNETENGNHWIKLKLIGTKSNRTAVGARVRCVAGDRAQIDEVRSGGSFYSQNDLRIHFGLGAAARVDLLEISWPSGQKQQFKDVPVDRIFKIREGDDKL